MCECNQQFKYQAEIKEHLKDTKCPDPCLIYEGLAYCFMHEDLNNQQNFKPHAFDDKKNTDPPVKKVVHTNDLIVKCELLGLSFFTDKDKAKNSYKQYSRGKPNSPFAKENGTMLAKINLSSDDGRRSNFDDKSHFNFYEFAGVSLFEKIMDKEKL